MRPFKTMRAENVRAGDLLTLGPDGKARPALRRYPSVRMAARPWADYGDEDAEASKQADAPWVLMWAIQRLDCGGGAALAALGLANILKPSPAEAAEAKRLGVEFSAQGATVKAERCPSCGGRLPYTGGPIPTVACSAGCGHCACSFCVADRGVSA